MESICCVEKKKKEKKKQGRSKINKEKKNEK